MNAPMNKSKESTTINKTTRSAMIIENGLEYLRITEFPYIIDWILAWMALFFMSAMYIVDYITVMRQMSRLKQVPDQWCRSIPLTTMAQTTATASNYTTDSRKERLDRLNLMIKAETCFDEELCTILQSNSTARHIASMCMLRNNRSMHNSTNLIQNKKQNHTSSPIHNNLEERLQRLWPKLLELPSAAPDGDDCGTTYPFDISLIVPAYKDLSSDVVEILTHALEQCQNPSNVLVVVVDAGKNAPDFAERIKHVPQQDVTNQSNGSSSSKKWGQVKLVQYNLGGGRGSCLNYGALFANGKIMTFLHSDTFLPRNWDSMILQALLPAPPAPKDKIKNSRRRIAHACAFRMAIHPTDSTTCSPPGLMGVYKVLGYIRCNWCSLPYGDSALSLPAQYFHHLGGFPDQPLMEDYELVTLLRKRAQLFPEQMVMLPGYASCSPRRWQSYGVCYTTLVNALCIHRYKHGMGADELYKFYYRC